MKNTDENVDFINRGEFEGNYDGVWVHGYVDYTPADPDVGMCELFCSSVDLIHITNIEQAKDAHGDDVEQRLIELAEHVADLMAKRAEEAVKSKRDRRSED